MNYQIIGEPLPAVICNVDANETLITERGSMSWMTPNMKMETTTNGGIGKAFGRMFSGESIFQNRYTAIAVPGKSHLHPAFPVRFVRLKLHRVVRLLFKKAVFWQVKQALSCRFISKKDLAPAFSAVRDSSCRDCRDTESHLLRLTDLRANITLHPVSRW